MAAAFIPYTAAALYQTVRLLVRPDLLALPFIDILHFGLWVGPVYFVARGMLAFRAINRLPPEQTLVLTQLSNPFENRVKVPRPSAFPNKGVFVLLMLFLLGWVGLMFLIGSFVIIFNMSWPVILPVSVVFIAMM